MSRRAPKLPPRVALVEAKRASRAWARFVLGSAFAGANVLLSALPRWTRSREGSTYD